MSESQESTQPQADEYSHQAPNNGSRSTSGIVSGEAQTMNSTSQPVSADPTAVPPVIDVALLAAQMAEMQRKFAILAEENKNLRAASKLSETDKAAAEKAAADKVEPAKAEAAKVEAEKAEAAKAEAAKVEADKVEADKVEAAKAEAAKVEAAKVEAEAARVQKAKEDAILRVIVGEAGYADENDHLVQASNQTDIFDPEYPDPDEFEPSRKRPGGLFTADGSRWQESDDDTGIGAIATTTDWNAPISGGDAQNLDAPTSGGDDSHNWNAGLGDQTWNDDDNAQYPLDEASTSTAGGDDQADQANLQQEEAEEEENVPVKPLTDVAPSKLPPNNVLKGPIHPESANIIKFQAQHLYESDLSHHSLFSRTVECRDGSTKTIPPKSVVLHPDYVAPLIDLLMSALTLFADTTHHSYYEDLIKHETYSIISKRTFRVDKESAQFPGTMEDSFRTKLSAVDQSFRQIFLSACIGFQHLCDQAHIAAYLRPLAILIRDRIGPSPYDQLRWAEIKIGIETADHLSIAFLRDTIGYFAAIMWSTAYSEYFLNVQATLDGELPLMPAHTALKVLMRRKSIVDFQIFEANLKSIDPEHAQYIIQWLSSTIQNVDNGKKFEMTKKFTASGDLPDRVEPLHLPENYPEEDSDGFDQNEYKQIRAQRDAWKAQEQHDDPCNEAYIKPYVSSESTIRKTYASEEGKLDLLVKKSKIQAGRPSIVTVTHSDDSESTKVLAQKSDHANLPDAAQSLSHPAALKSDAAKPLPSLPLAAYQPLPSRQVRPRRPFIAKSIPPTGSADPNDKAVAPAPTTDQSVPEGDQSSTIATKSQFSLLSATTNQTLPDNERFLYGEAIERPIKQIMDSSIQRTGAAVNMMFILAQEQGLGPLPTSGIGFLGGYAAIAKSLRYELSINNFEPPEYISSLRPNGVWDNDAELRIFLRLLSYFTYPEYLSMIHSANWELKRTDEPVYKNMDINCEQMTWLSIQIGEELGIPLRLGVSHKLLFSDKNILSISQGRCELLESGLIWVNRIEGAENGDCDHWEGFGPITEKDSSWKGPENIYEIGYHLSENGYPHKAILERIQPLTQGRLK